MKTLMNSVLLMMLYYQPGIAQTTITLQPDNIQGKDALIHGLQSEKNVNYGSNPQFMANAWTFQGTPGMVRSIVNFDLTSIPLNAVVNKAELYLYGMDSITSGGQVNSSLSGPNNTTLQRITSSWEENTVTWNTQPTYSTQNIVSVPASTASVQDYIINVSALVQDMINDPAHSFGFMLKLVDENYYRRINFCSSDYSNPLRRPKLVITYTPPGPDVCITLQPGEKDGKDALVHGLQSEWNTNYGNNIQFMANAWTFGGTPGVVRSAIQFDLSTIPANAVVTKAELSLYAMDSISSGGQVHSTLNGPNNCVLERIISSWDESTIVWTNKPNTTATNSVSIPASTNSQQDYVINVAPLVQDMIADPANSFGFMMKLADENYYRRMNFCSSDYKIPERRPKLKLCYTIPLGITGTSTEIPSMEIYPNPAADWITIRVSEQLINNIYTLTDQLGRTVLSGKLTTENSTINIGGLAKGIYNLTVSDQHLLSKRIIKN